MMVHEKRPKTVTNTSRHQPASSREADCVYGLITGRHSVSRRNRASWYLRQLNKIILPEDIDDGEETELDQELDCNNVNDGDISQRGQETKYISLVSIVSGSVCELNDETCSKLGSSNSDGQFLITPNTRAIFLSRTIATSIILDLSPSMISVDAQDGCVYLDPVFDALRKTLLLMVKSHTIPSSMGADKHFVLQPKVFISVIAYTPFIVAKNNQVLVQNRRISYMNIDQVLVELWISLNRLIKEIYELVSNTCGVNLSFETSKTDNVFLFPQANGGGGPMRHPGCILDDIFELGLFASGLMPRNSRLSILIISDSLFSTTNNLNLFRLKSIAVSFISLGSAFPSPSTCFGYMPYLDLLKFISRTTLGVCLTHQDLINSCKDIIKLNQIKFVSNPLQKLFCWTLHCDVDCDKFCSTPKANNFQDIFMNSNQVNPDNFDLNSEHIARFFCVDQPRNPFTASTSDIEDNQFGLFDTARFGYNDWRSFKQLDRSLDADFEQVLACLLREGYLIKSIQFKRKEVLRIVARVVLHWRHNLDLEQELTAPYWNSTDPFDMNDQAGQLLMRPFNTPLYGDTFCEIFVHGSYSFLHNLYCDKRGKRRSEFRDIAYRQFKQLIDGIYQTHDRLQYLSKFYRDPSLSKVPSFLLHGNSLLYEQPHTRKITSTIENVVDETKTSEFQEYWQKISCLDNKSWINLMHIHTLRLVLEHDQPKYKNIHYQNANGRYTHVQCRRALSAVSNFIKNYSSFALLEDSTYVKFIYNKDDDLREIETSATKGFIVIRINKLLPIIVIYLMFTSGILDSHRVQIVSYLENQLINCKLGKTKTLTTAVTNDNILKSKTISPSSESCCVLIKSPLERMLKVYSRNFIGDILVYNWAHGLPGSCPYNLQQSLKVTVTNPNSDQSTSAAKQPKGDVVKNQQRDYMSDDLVNRYNLVFGKYLYGVRVIHTISNLSHDIVQSLAANTLSKISAILVNLRIKQGYHIAFNNSGIMNLVAELSMEDPSNSNDASGCLCQYIVFPPTVTNYGQNVHTVLTSHQPIQPGVSAIKPLRLSESLGNSDRFSRPPHSDMSPSAHLEVNNYGEVKIIREYWIEQQYGQSSQSEAYHRSLHNLRYSQVLDHLFLTDSSIFECLLTYDLLQLLCDKLSPYYELDTCFARTDLSNVKPIPSPTNSDHSSSTVNQHNAGDCANDDTAPPSPSLPSSFIDGTSRDPYNTRLPLLELDYKLSLCKFLDHCQLAGLSLLLFRDSSQYHENPVLTAQSDWPTEKQTFENRHNIAANHGTTVGSSSYSASKSKCNALNTRKMSMDVNEINHDHTEYARREHRSSYQMDSNPTSSSHVSPFYGISLNHAFLDTLHKRLKQMHDKELTLTGFDRSKLTPYLKLRQVSCCYASDKSAKDSYKFHHRRLFFDEAEKLVEDEYEQQQEDPNQVVEWRCFLRRGNQENLMIVLTPASIADVNKWLNVVGGNTPGVINGRGHDTVCPIFVFRCSSSMINDQVLSFIDDDARTDMERMHRAGLESDLWLHFGQPCKYQDKLITVNDELNSEIASLTKLDSLSSASSGDEKTLEVVHFRAFLRKIKNTVLKSRFSSLNDAYLSELFIHKNDVLYYINNVDGDMQKKYHVSSQLRNLAEFIKSYEQFNDLLPTKPTKNCNQMLNSILLQKCGLFINQPIARFDESNPLIKHLYDRKLLCLMRRNYKVELPILEEKLKGSKLIKNLLNSSNANNSNQSQQTNQLPTVARPTNEDQSDIPPTNASCYSNTVPNNYAVIDLHSTQLMSGNGNGSLAATPNSMARSDGYNRSFMDFRANNLQQQSLGSPSAVFADRSRPLRAAPGTSSSQNSASLLGSSTDESFILEAFRNPKAPCPMKDVDMSSLIEDPDDITLRHEAHMAEVLRLSCENIESRQYGRVLKSRAGYNQSHSVIDQALKRVDSLGRLEHFCLTPLLFSPFWRSKLAPVRDHTIVEAMDLAENVSAAQTIDMADIAVAASSAEQAADAMLSSESPKSNDSRAPNGSTLDNHLKHEDPNDQWHQLVCTNYIKEYEQYIQTLGFNAIQIRLNQHQQHPANSSETSTLANKRDQSSLLSTNPTNITSTYNSGYLIKFLNSGCLVFKVGFCKPYVYSVLYSIEGDRLNGSSSNGTKSMKVNMTAFLDELDHIKLTMHLHSFTYDYHLRSMYSYVSGRQQTLFPGYHLTSALDEFTKYYQKPPNYARNHILCGEIVVDNIKMTGQQLYNYIVTHNSIYHMQVLEMASLSHNNLGRPSKSSRLLTESRTPMDQPEVDGKNGVLGRNHANDYVLVELRRDRIRHFDSKESDIFDCALLITHDVQPSSSNGASKCSIALRYYLILTNQRDLYPKLIHTDTGSVVSLSGCHRPIRLGATTRAKQNTTAQAIEENEAQTLDQPSQNVAGVEKANEASTTIQQLATTSVEVQAATDSGTDASAKLSSVSSSTTEDGDNENGPSSLQSADEKRPGICDEQIIYLGYFSSEEMNVLHFMDEKTASLKSHIEQVVRLAEVHYRRDYLWQKLMQRMPPSSVGSSKADEPPLSTEELLQLLSIVESIDLSTLDSQLSVFSSMPTNWYAGLLKAFMELKQSGLRQHRIYIAKAARLLLLFIDPNCHSAFILLTMDMDRGSVELNMLLKDKSECCKTLSNPTEQQEQQQTPKGQVIELDEDCRELINLFINFCATYMWSTLLNV